MQQAKVQSSGIVPCSVGINYTIWESYEERLNKLQQECPHIPLSGKAGKDSQRSVEYKHRDAWGCLWHFPGMGLDGQVIEHPLDTWEKLETWKPPSSAEHVAAIRKEAEKLPLEQRPRHASLEHGFLFLRLTYLRGFDNFMLDIGEDNPKIYELRDVVADYWYEVTKARIECGARYIGGGDDLGMQDRLPISPESWRKLIKPAYRRIFGLARERGFPVRLHTDGYIVDIIPDLLEIGVTDLNPQELVNGIDNLAKLIKGKVHISLDVDRQNITVFGTPEEVDAHIRKCIQTLGSPQGGLSLIWGVYPATPIENIEATVRAMEKYRDLWADGER